MNIKIFQIHYLSEQAAHLDPNFVPFDNGRSVPPHNFEYSVMIENALSNFSPNTDLLGFVSWKFSQKTGVDGGTFIRYINSNPGFDSYFINPFPEQACFSSVWRQGEHFHPNLVDLTSKLLRRAGYKLDLPALRTPFEHLCYCNYWVGTKRFWTAYIDFVSPLYNYILNEASASELKSLNANADNLIKAPYTPFIFERLYSTFLALNPHFKAKPYYYPEKILQTKSPKVASLISGLQESSASHSWAKYFFYRSLLWWRLYGLSKFKSKLFFKKGLRS